MLKNIQCWCCGQFFEDKKLSEEHIIPDALGGRLKSTKLLCTTCNNATLGSLDNELYQQILPMASMTGAFSSKNKSKLYPAFNINGESMPVLSSGILAPRIEITNPYSGKPIVIVAKDVPSLFNAVKRRLCELYKGDKDKVALHMKHITNDYSSKIIVHSNSRDSNDLRTSPMGGLAFFKAIAKIMVNFAIENGITINELSEVIDYIKTSSEDDFKKKNKAFCRPFFPSYYVPYYPNGNEISHLLHFKADRDNGNLIGYVELFNTICCMIVLSYDYKGANFYRTYLQDINRLGVYIDRDLFHKPNSFYLTQFQNPPTPEKTEEQMHSRYYRLQKTAISKMDNVMIVELEDPIPFRKR